MFPNASIVPQVISVMVVDNGIPEDTHTYSVSLVSASQGRVALSQTITVSVPISDNANGVFGFAPMSLQLVIPKAQQSFSLIVSRSFSLRFVTLFPQMLTFRFQVKLEA